MERKVPFQTGEFYHLYTRGVEKRTVFTNEVDSERFLTLLMISNDEKKRQVIEPKPRPARVPLAGQT